MASLLHLFVVVVLIHACSGLSTLQAGNTLTRFNQFISTLTTTLSDSSRAVHSSGGAAGGVVSEGQGYGLLIGSITAASLGTSHASFPDVAAKTYAIFRGWKKMCTLSTSSGSCQTGSFYCTSSGTSYPCLPHWQFDDAITAASGTGNAPDGDEDAILGMIVLVLTTESVKSQYTWWNEVALWAYQSAKQFYVSNTIPKVIGSTTYIALKLGACWGGWDCNNPSYHAPGAYRTFRNYIARYATTFGDTAATVTDYTTKYNNLIATSYAIILADQCDSTGLTTNWYVPSSTDPSAQYTTGCSGSGTPAGEYGAEAARGVWRVVLDYLWYGDTTNTAKYLTPIVAHLASKYSAGSYGQISTGCLVTSVFSSWTASSNAFIFGPTFSSLVRPLSTVTGQQAMLDTAGSLVAASTISAYYAGSWTAIATFTLNGDLERVGTIIRGGPLPPAVPSPPPTPTPTPTPTPINPSSLLTYTCSYAYVDNYWIEVQNLAAPSSSTVNIECSDGTHRLCTWVASLSKYQCASSGNACTAPRSAVVTGAGQGCCNLGKSCTTISYVAEDTSTGATSDVNAGLVVGIVIAAVVLVVLIVIIVYKVKTSSDFRPMESY